MANESRVSELHPSKFVDISWHFMRILCMNQTTRIGTRQAIQKRLRQRDTCAHDVSAPRDLIDFSLPSSKSFSGGSESIKYDNVKVAISAVHQIEISQREQEFVQFLATKFVSFQDPILFRSFHPRSIIPETHCDNLWKVRSDRSPRWEIWKKKSPFASSNATELNQNKHHFDQLKVDRTAGILSEMSLPQQVLNPVPNTERSRTAIRWLQPEELPDLSRLLGGPGFSRNQSSHLITSCHLTGKVRGALNGLARARTLRTFWNRNNTGKKLDDQRSKESTKHRFRRPTRSQLD